jgi:hypothetical protein
MRELTNEEVQVVSGGILSEPLAKLIVTVLEPGSFPVTAEVDLADIFTPFQ